LGATGPHDFLRKTRERRLRKTTRIFFNDILEPAIFTTTLATGSRATTLWCKPVSNCRNPVPERRPLRAGLADYNWQKTEYHIGQIGSSLITSDSDRIFSNGTGTARHVLIATTLRLNEAEAGWRKKSRLIPKCSAKVFENLIDEKPGAKVSAS